MRYGVFLRNPAILGFLVSAVFWWCVGYGWWFSCLSHRSTLVFAALYAVVAIGSSYFAAGEWWFIAGIAILDIALIVLVYDRGSRLKDW